MQSWDSALQGMVMLQWNWGSELGAQSGGSSELGLWLEQEHQWLVLSFQADAMRLVLTNEEGQQTRTTYAAETSGCWEGKSVAGATLIGTGSKEKRTSPFCPPTLKFPVTSLIGRASPGASRQKRNIICRGSAPVSESRVRRGGNWTQETMA